MAFIDLQNERTIKFKAAKTIDNIFMKVFSYFSKLNLTKTINAFEIGENYITLDYKGNIKLYAIKLETNSNKTIRMKQLGIFLSSFKYNNDSQVMLSFVKKDGLEAIYLFCFNEKVADSFASVFSTQLLSGYNIINAIYHTFLINCFDIQNKQLINKYSDIKQTEPLDALYKKMPSIIAIASDNILRNYTPYQVTSFVDDLNFNIIDFMKLNWEGVCNLFFDFNINATISRLKLLEKSAKMGDSEYMKQYSELLKVENKDALSQIQEFSYLANCTFFLKDTSMISSFQNVFKVTAEERYFGIDNLLPKTLLLARDIDFDILMHETNIQKYFTTSLSKDCMSGIKADGTKILIPDFVGTDVNGNFINYMFKLNESPHALLFGTTGAGKSVAILKMMNQIIDYDYETGEAHSLNEDRKIRYINVGYTGGHIFKNIKESSTRAGDCKVEIISSKIENIRFSLFDFDNLKMPTDDELDFFASFINLILEASSSSSDMLVLSAIEIGALKRAIKELCHKTKIPDMRLSEISVIGQGAYDQIIDEILSIRDENGNAIYSMNTLSSELPSKYDRFKKPTLADLINVITGNSNDINKTEEERSIFKSLNSKMMTIAEMQLFANFSNIDNSKNFPLYYTDFDRIKDNKINFIAVGWLLIKTWFNADKEEALRRINSGKPRPDSFYIVEEAHNFLGLDVFAHLFEVFAREVRKYGVHLILITQNAGDVKPVLTSLFNTRMFIYTAQRKEEVALHIKNFNGGKDLDPESQEVFDKIDNGGSDPNKTILILHDKGISGIKLPNPDLKKFYLFGPYDLDTKVDEN